MPKYYCDYCDTFLTHDSPSVRKTHCQGRKHKDNVKFYYQKWMEDQAQQLIDATTAMYKAGKIVSMPFGSTNAIIPPTNMVLPPNYMSSMPPNCMPPMPSMLGVSSGTGIPQGMMAPPLSGEPPPGVTSMMVPPPSMMMPTF